MKREENSEMKAKILEAVITCKIEAAGAEVPLSKISYRAGISERTLNRYFPDKEMLFYDAAIRYLRLRFERFSQLYLSQLPPGLSGLERLISLFRLQIDGNRNDMRSAKVFVRAYTTALRTAVYRDLPASGYDTDLRQIVIACIEDGIKDGSMRPDIVPMEAYILLSSNYTGLLQRLIYTYSIDRSESEHKKELLLVFDEYVNMLAEYLSAEGRSSLKKQQ